MFPFRFFLEVFLSLKKYLHGKITETDVTSLVDGSKLESENKQLNKVIETLRSENEQLSEIAAQE